MRRRWPLVAALVVSLAASATAQEYPAPPFYALLPHDYPYPLIRVCSTAWGICAVPVTVPPGGPCACLAPNGAWVTGLCVR